MPFLTKYTSYNLWGDVVTHNIKLGVTAGGGVASFVGPPLDSAVSNGTGLYTITLGDAPYVQCVKCIANVSQVTLDTNLGVNVVQPVDGTGNTMTIQFFTTTTGAAVEPTNAAIVYIELCFRQMGVP